MSAAGLLCVLLGIWLVSACTSGDPIDAEQARAELEELAGPLKLEDVPEGARIVDRGLRDECHNPAFDRETPAVWLEYEVDEAQAGAVAAELVDRFEQAGWARNDANLGVGFDAPGDDGGHGLVSSGSGVDVTVWLGDWSCG